MPDDSSQNLIGPPMRAGFRRSSLVLARALGGLLRYFLSLAVMLITLALVLGGAIAVILAVSGHSLPVPQQALSKVESRLNGAIAPSLPGARLAISGMDLSLTPEFEPRLVLRDMRLINGAGAVVVQLPQLKAVLAPHPLAQGQMILRQLQLVGADLRLSRDAAGQLDIGFAIGNLPQGDLAGKSAGVDARGIFAITDDLLASPLAAELTLIEAQDLRLTLRDARVGGNLGGANDAVMQATIQGTGQLRAQRSGNEVALNLGITLLGPSPSQSDATMGGHDNSQAQTPASRGQVDLALTYALGSKAAQMTARLDRVYARDLAVQAAPLAFMSVLDAPIFGQIRADLSPQGLGALSAQLSLGAGALDPMAVQDRAPQGGDAKAGAGGAASNIAQSSRVAFQSAQVNLTYDPALGRIALDDLAIVSQTLTLRGAGHADMRRAGGAAMSGPFAGEIPAGFDVQLRLDHLRLARPEIFAQPVVFDAGTAQLRLTLAPFAVDIDHLGLTTGDTRLAAIGQFTAQDQGWSRDLNLTVNQIGAGKLLGLWPKSLLPGTRNWLDRNLLAARFADLRLSLAQNPGAVPDLDLSYRFDDMVLTPVAGLPAITGGAGRGGIAGRIFSLHLDAGRTTPPLGGDIDLAGSDFVIPDISRFPATGELTLRSAGNLTATLSLIDQRPFQFLSKSGQAVDFAKGVARLTTRLRLPLQKVVTLPDISFQILGQVAGFETSRLAKGHMIAMPAVQVAATKAGLRLSGAGQISGVDFTARYAMDFGKGAPPARVTGDLPLTDAALRVFGLRLPDGMVQGTGRADVTIDLPRGGPPRLTLTSDLRGIALSLPALAYAKPAKTKGDLRADISLTSPPQVTGLALKAGDLHMDDGRVTIGPQGAFERADFLGLTLGKWLAGDVALLAQGAGNPLRIELGKSDGQSGARVDMRFMPPLGGGGAGQVGADMPLSLRLDRLRISDTITMRDFQGDFIGEKGALAGNFAARLAAGGTPIQGQLTPAPHGTAVRITAADAGQALAQAGVYRAARGGQLDLRLTPLPQKGSYDGQVTLSRLRVQNNSVLADLLNAISVVGLLDQLGGPGILFNTVTGQFQLTPAGIDVREGVATGASLGVTLQGVYRFAQRDMDMQGVISPIYLLNGVGALISAPGEGVLGFNYSLRGPVDDPNVRVNPLSVLLPGFLRNIFKPPTATLETTAP